MSSPDPCDAARAAFVITSHFFPIAQDPKMKAQWIKDALPFSDCSHLSSEKEKMLKIQKCLKENANPNACNNLIRDLNHCFCSSKTVQWIVEQAADSLEPGLKIPVCVKDMRKN